MHFGSSVSVTKLYFIRQTLEKLLLNPQLSECRSGFYLVSGFKTLHTRSVKEATHCRYHSPNRFQFCHSGYSSYQPTATRYLSSKKTAGKEIESATSLEINVNRVLLDLFHQCCTSLERFFFYFNKKQVSPPDLSSRIRDRYGTPNFPILRKKFMLEDTRCSSCYRCTF